MADASALARGHTERAVEVIAEIMDHAWEPKDRLAAARELLDRGHGKPTNTVVAIPLSRSRAAALLGATDEELLAAVRAQSLPRLRDAEGAIEATFTEVPAPASAGGASALDALLSDDPLLA